MSLDQPPVDVAGLCAVADSPRFTESLISFRLEVVASCGIGHSVGTTRYSLLTYQSAKRYTLTVDVSAVRDLYGTLIEEGANRGILVTTSHFGKDSIEFAKDKQITLINGDELLSLLKKYGYEYFVDIKAARALLK